MSEVCLVDSDTLSELSRGHPRVTANARTYLERHGRLTLSAITVFERLRGYRAALAKGKPFERQLDAFEALAAACRVLPVDGIVADRAATYWAMLGVRARRALGDIFIAATASVNGLSLVTRNRRDFEPIARLDPALELRDWAR
jgi:predicted nucleic acid-binding protein